MYFKGRIRLQSEVLFSAGLGEGLNIQISFDCWQNFYLVNSGRGCEYHFISSGTVQRFDFILLKCSNESFYHFIILPGLAMFGFAINISNIFLSAIHAKRPVLRTVLVILENCIKSFVGKFFV